MPAANADVGLFDEVQIAMLRDAIGPDELLAMLLDLPPTAAASLAAIGDALGCGDIAEARRAAHTLKGCASTFGAARLATMACEIELDLPSIEAMRQRMPVLAATLALTAAALEKAAGVTA